MKVLLCSLLAISTLAATPVPAAKEGKQRAPKVNWQTNTGHRLSFADIRHNARCRYYNLKDNRPCGAKAGTPCKICGG